MKFLATEIDGLLEIEIEPKEDSRGFFARLFCPDEMKLEGMNFAPVQINLSRNILPYTLRGMHYQDPPYAEAKIVRAVRGSMFDVAVDLRADSATHFRWIGRILDAKRGNAVLIPEGFAHGFLTLEPDTDVLYLMSRPYVTDHAKGFRYDDPSVHIAWPHTPAIIAPADREWPALSES